MPRLSVILALGHDPGRASRTLRSTLAALPRDSRLVIIAGDGVDPATGNDRRVEVHATDGPVSGQQAMNWLLQHTDSELVARADPGDAALPWRFRSAFGALDRNADVMFAPLMGAGTTPRGFTFSDPTGTAPLRTATLRLHLMLSSRITSGTLVARRSALAAVGGYRDTALAEYDLALRLALSPARLHRLSVPGVVTGEAPASAGGGERRRETEGLVADMFRSLSTQLLGRAYLRLPVLAALPLSAEELDEELSAFQADMRRAAQPLPLVERHPLLRALRRRIAATRTLHRSEMTSVAW
ncbi:hypothetical protein ACFFGH_27685 [Lysobacter korlensis]|uniref:Glycosyltransferase 2-like domain-containing protein n=1 Tax=Lysobacter korlensis TaxID=553636 RepID=A0ABV6RXC5_9GAMM